MNINFREINKSNYNECIMLKVSPDQVDFVAPNSFSLVQAAYEDNLFPLGIYNHNEMIGFILYDYDEDLSGWSFSRFMIDSKHQNKGYGKTALSKFLEFFHNKYPKEKLFTSVETDNPIAIKLYEGFGFKLGEIFEYNVDTKTYREYRMTKTTW